MRLRMQQKACSAERILGQVTQSQEFGKIHPQLSRNMSTAALARANRLISKLYHFGI